MRPGGRVAGLDESGGERKPSEDLAVGYWLTIGGVGMGIGSVEVRSFGAGGLG